MTKIKKNKIIGTFSEDLRETELELKTVKKAQALLWNEYDYKNKKVKDSKKEDKKD